MEELQPSTGGTSIGTRPSISGPPRSTSKMKQSVLTNFFSQMKTTKNPKTTTQNQVSILSNSLFTQNIAFCNKKDTECKRPSLSLINYITKSLQDWVQNGADPLLNRPLPVPGKNVSSQKKSTTNPISKAKALNLKQKGGPFKKSLPVHPPKKTISGQMKNPRNPTSKQSRAWNQSSGPLKRPLQGHSHKSFGKIKDLTFKPSIQIQNVAQSKKVAFNSVLKFRKSYKVRLT